MFFFFSHINEKEAAAIAKIRSSDRNFRADDIRATDIYLGMPQDSFFIELGSLKTEGKPEAKRLGKRLVETSRQHFNYIYDIYSEEEGATAQMVKDKEFIEAYERAYRKLVQTEKSDTKYELRTLKIPALYIDAFWLHNTEGVNMDKYLPVRSISALEEGEIYSEEEFFSRVKEAAMRFNMDDPEIGA